MTYNSKSSKKHFKKKRNKTVKGGMFERIGKLFKMNRTTNNEVNNFFKKKGQKNPYSKKINVSPVEESTPAPSNAALSTAEKPNLLTPLGTRMGGYYKHTKKHRK